MSPGLGFAAIILIAASPPTADLEAEVVEVFDELCTVCHDSSGDPTTAEGLDLEGSPSSLVGKTSVVTGKPFVVPGDPDGSYLLDKMVGKPGIAGEPMPLDEDPPSGEQLDVIVAWIGALEPDGGASGPQASASATPVNQNTPVAGGREADPSHGDRATQDRARPPFHGTHFNMLPTTTPVRKRSLQFRIDHRFGRIGTERGAFGLDAGVVMSLGLSYGILDGWDVRLRRTNSRKDWELGTVYVPVRQEDGMPLSFGGMASVEYLRDFDVANAWTGSLMTMLSRQWFQRWSTLLAIGYHFNSNHEPRVFVEYEGEGRVLVNDRRDTLTLGVASTVLLGKRKRWGIDIEYVLPIPDGSNPNVFHYRGGDADPSGMKPIGAWTIGGSLKTGLHFFQVFLTNNREIHTNLAAAGGQSDNPFDTPGVDSKNPFLEFNFFLGFNLTRRFDF